MSNYTRALDESLATLAALRELEGAIERAANRCITTLRRDGKLLICGNGGSAAEAMHLTGELVGRYKVERRPLAAITLGTDPVVASCIGNDYCFEDAFSRQVRALGRPGDVLIVFSTSGRSANILEAMRAARQAEIATIAFLGRDGGTALALADEAIVVRHTDTARIQEGHQFLMHSLMDLLEASIAQDAAGVDTQLRL
jgi:D-sedoheptulose 7-phosphate isomerase